MIVTKVLLAVEEPDGELMAKIPLGTVVVSTNPRIADVKIRVESKAILVFLGNRDRNCNSGLMSDMFHRKASLNVSIEKCVDVEVWSTERS